MLSRSFDIALQDARTILKLISTALQVALVKSTVNPSGAPCSFGKLKGGKFRLPTKTSVVSAFCPIAIMLISIKNKVAENVRNLIL